MSRESEVAPPADPKKMRALAHPIRIELLEMLAVEGPMTATQCAELIGQSPSLCSFHLRQLAKYGFVEEADPTGGRDRPWRAVRDQARFGEVPHDEEGTAANAALMRAFLEREFARAMAFAEATKDEPAEWWQASFFMGALAWLTAGELSDVAHEIDDLITRKFRDRVEHPEQRPPGSKPVRLLAAGYPIPGWGR
jgi:DNA-binding transcriptional ArsR family regulator